MGSLFAATSQRLPDSSLFAFAEAETELKKDAVVCNIPTASRDVPPPPKAIRFAMLMMTGPDGGRDVSFSSSPGRYEDGVDDRCDDGAEDEEEEAYDCAVLLLLLLVFCTKMRLLPLARWPVVGGGI